MISSSGSALVVGVGGRTHRAQSSVLITEKRDPCVTRRHTRLHLDQAMLIAKGVRFMLRLLDV